MYERKKETKKFLDEIKQLVKQFRHLAFCFDTFLVCHELTKEYINSVDKLSAMAKSAFTKAILVDYCTPFMKNEFVQGENITVSTKYLSKNQLFDKNIHEALLELRHQLVAHASYEHPALLTTAAEIINDRKDPNTHESVFIPAQFFLQNISMLFIDSAKILNQFDNHFNICKSLTMDKATELSELLSAKLLKYAPVANSAEFVEVLEQTGQNETSAKNESDPLNIEPKEIDLKIGKTNIQFNITRVRMDRPYTGEFEGNGYRIVSELSKEDSSKVNINVTFNPIR